MNNLQSYEEYILESLDVITWIVMTKTGRVVLNTKDEQQAKEKAAESPEYVLWFRKGKDPIRRA